MSPYPELPATQPHPRLPSRGKAVLAMTLLWLVIGAFVGSGCIPGERSLIGIISGALAGMLIMPHLGVVLGLVGASSWETLLGGVSGLVFGPIGSLVWGEPMRLFHANLGLLVGAFIGATFLGMLRFVKRRVYTSLSA